MSKSIHQVTATYQAATGVPPFFKGRTYTLTIERRYMPQTTHVVILRAEEIEESTYVDYPSEQAFWRDWQEVG
ncbi:hypothetical protein GCM10027422_28860 [Hymenobacter arcticus]